MARPDIAIVSLGTTIGWRWADEALAELIREGGATCELVPVRGGASGRLRRGVGPVRGGASARLRRGMALTDLVEAGAARRAGRGLSATALIYSSVTAALL